MIPYIRDLDGKSNFVVVSYFTNEGYKKEMNRLIASLDEYNISYDIREVEPRGNWHLNTQYKAEFIKEMLELYDRVEERKNEAHIDKEKHEELRKLKKKRNKLRKELQIGD